ncbi:MULTISPECIES: helix-turn-helix transcriptional regulator [Clostridia]|uniref:helix-turn-helix transcriptional regulator n=1 Tax=Clostridia TaxID=186801 RepID=UPI0031B5EFAF
MISTFRTSDFQISGSAISPHKNIHALGITTSSVSKWETNNTYPDISLLSPLARLLGTAVDNVFNFKQKLSEEEIDTLLNRSK